MKKLIVAGAAVVVLALSAVGVRQVVTSDSAPCAKPRTLFDSEQSASIAVLEDYIEQNIATAFKHPEQLVWGSDDYSPILLPNKIAARIMLMESGSITPPRYYHVTLTRDCAGGEWTVVEFKPVKGGTS